MKILRTETVYTSKNFCIKRNEIERDGKLFTKDFVDRNPVVLIIPYTPEGDVYLEYQFRDAMGKYCWEIIGGNMEEGSDPLENAKRELQEEAGLSAKKWIQIARWELSVNMYAPIYVFAATDLQQGEATLDIDEDLSVKKMALENALEKIDNGEIEGASHVASLFLFQKLQKEGKL